VLVAHVCNLNYSGGRDAENHGSKPAWANSAQDPISRKPITAKGCGVAHNSEFKPQYRKKKEKKKKKLKTKILEGK
jgi:hypothetical protein